MRPSGAGAPYPPRKVRNSETSETAWSKQTEKYGVSEISWFFGLRSRAATTPAKSETTMDAANILAMPPKFRTSVDWFRVGFVCIHKVGKPEHPIKMGGSNNPVSLVSEFRTFWEGVYGLLTFNRRSRRGGHRDDL
jgi:hypothetical protein